MNIEYQVCSLMLSKRLRELGVKQESLFYWNIENSDYDEWKLHDICSYNGYSAFTASELLELLPIFISGYNILTIQKDYPIGFETFYSCSRTELGFDSKDENICNSLAKMLIHLIENNLLEIK